MKKTFFLLCLLMSIGISARQVNIVMVNGIRYRITEGDNYAVVDLLKDRYSLDNYKNVKILTISDSVEYENMKYPVTKIGGWAFHDSSIDSLYLPNTIQSIGEYAFYNSRIKYAELGNSLKFIGAYAFNPCLMDTVILPATLKSVGTNAFFCYSSVDFFCYAKTPPSGAWYAICDNTSTQSSLRTMNFFVPYGCANAYKQNETWARLNIIEMPCAYLSEIKVNDVAIPFFNYLDFDYTIKLPEGTLNVPSVSASPIFPDNCVVSIKEAMSLQDTTYIKTLLKDKSDSCEYHISFIVDKDDTSLDNKLDITTCLKKYIKEGQLLFNIGNLTFDILGRKQE